MKRCFLISLAVALAPLVLSAQNAEREQVRHDWNRDGFIDKAEIVHSDEEQSVSLYVYFGQRGGRFSAPIIASRFAGSTPISGDPAHLKLSAAKSIVVESSHIGIGRSKYEAATIVAFRSGQMRVIGYQISRWDSLDPDAATSCDVNFNTGRAIVLDAGKEKSRIVRHRLTPVPIQNWKQLPELRGVCPAYE